MKKKVYARIARVVCFICHGRCCWEGMEFEQKEKKVTLIRKSGKPCGALNRLTGSCRNYRPTKEFMRFWLCEQYKCRVLNLLSRLLSQSIWNGIKT